MSNNKEIQCIECGGTTRVTSLVFDYEESGRTAPIHPDPQMCIDVTRERRAAIVAHHELAAAHRAKEAREAREAHEARVAAVDARRAAVAAQLEDAQKLCGECLRGLECSDPSCDDGLVPDPMAEPEAPEPVTISGTITRGGVTTSFNIFDNGGRPAWTQGGIATHEQLAVNIPLLVGLVAAVAKDDA